MEEIVSIVLNAGHFAVVWADVVGNVVKVMEGQGSQRSIPRWANHMSRMLIPNSLVPFGTVAAHFGNFRGQHVKHIEQLDTHNCAPTACGTVWEMLTNGEFKANQHSPDQLRRLVVDKCEKWLPSVRALSGLAGILPKALTALDVVSSAVTQKKNLSSSKARDSAKATASAWQKGLALAAPKSCAASVARPAATDSQWHVPIARTAVASLACLTGWI
jgi:hypothetical protein